MTHQSVYVARSDAGPIKVGIAADAEKRGRALSQCQPFGVAIVETFSAAAARQVEAIAHGLLADRRVRGEWFDVSPEEAIAVVHEAIQIAATIEPRRDSATMAMGFRVAPETLAALREAAKEEHRTVASLVEHLAVQFLRQEGLLK